MKWMLNCYLLKKNENGKNLYRKCYYFVKDVQDNVQDKKPYLCGCARC